ncbi:MAG: hypothetical protein ACT4PV_02295 [Planctomycetaceae bacterium]
MNLLAHRRKDQLEVEEIWKLRASIDRAPLRSWAGRLDLTDRLEPFLPFRRSCRFWPS